MISKTKAGITGTVKMATSAPGQVTHGLAKIGAILVEPFIPKDKTNDGSNGDKTNV